MTVQTTAPRTNGAASPAAPAAAPPVELTAKEQRRVREEARREALAKFKAAEVERLTAAEAKKRGTPAPSQSAAGTAPAAAPAEPLDPTRTDADRRADAAVFLRGVVWPVASLGAWLFGYDLAELTEAMAKDDAGSWVPLARRYRWLDLLFTWAGAPARLIARVKELKRKREGKETKA